jgi:hypothetical protein
MRVDRQDRQPSPWPCVAMLAGLLLFCLMAPRYWRNTVSTDEVALGLSTDTTSASSKIADKANFAGWPFGANVGRLVGLPNTGFAYLLDAPTIEELIDARSAVAYVAERASQIGGESFEWSVLLREAAKIQANAKRPAAQFAKVNQTSPEFAAAMEFVGQMLGEYSSPDGVGRLAVQVADDLPRWLAGCGQRYDHLLAEYPAAKAASPANQGGRFSVRVLDPNDRLAMLPAPRELEGAHGWCVPQVLFDQLDRLASQADSAQWASHVRNQLHALTDRDQLQGDDVQSVLGDLSDSAADALRMADQTNNDRLRVELLRAHWALARRLDCWNAMHEKRVAAHFQGRVAARGSLSPYFAGTSEHSAAPPDVTSLSNDLESYEKCRDPKLGRYVAQQRQALKSSADTVDRTLADAVEQHYRNANIRVAITAEMLNRLVGAQRIESKPVHDQIAGTFVHGQSNVRSESQVLLDPSADEWQLELNAKGVVESNTLANGGPVQFRSQGTTQFRARESIVVNDKGVHFKQSNVDANCRNRLVGVTTDYDWLPIFGGFARDRAMDEYRARQGRVKSQIESKVATQARDLLDQETREAVDQIRQQTYDRFASQLDAFGLKLLPVEMKTTPDRLVARLRVASEQQLGSHTPRPRALSDSLASAQVHETALTNLAMTLGLDGKRFTAPELQKMLREKFPQLASKTPIESRQDTIFQFAAEDAVQVHINDGRFELKISFASIELNHEVMKEPVVHAVYVPKVDGLNAELVRQGTLGIEGRFSSTDRAKLHNVFNRVLPPERHLPIVRIENPNDKRFQGLMITQLVLEDGWVGMAVGPNSSDRVAERSRSLK